MKIDDAGEFTDYFERVRGRTVRVVERVPRDRLEWSPGDGRFTFGDLIRHLAATERWMFAENVQGNPSRYPGHGPELASGYDAVVDYLRRMHEESVAIFRGLSESELLRKCPTPGGIQLTTWKWLRAMPEHEIHHRGQLYTMLGLIGVEAPPLYGLTERQVFENSEPLADGSNGG